MSDVPSRAQIQKGSHVSIETKKEQGTGRLRDGIVEDILTSSDSHPHGIKVRFQDGQVGRVKRVGNDQKIKKQSRFYCFFDFDSETSKLRYENTILLFDLSIS